MLPHGLGGESRSNIRGKSMVNGQQVNILVPPLVFPSDVLWPFLSDGRGSHDLQWILLGILNLKQFLDFFTFFLFGKLS